MGARSGQAIVAAPPDGRSMCRRHPLSDPQVAAYDAEMDEAAQQRIWEFRLQPHPEGGFYRRIHESQTVVEHDGKRRSALTAIDFLLPRGQVSQWHRVDADECWHWQEGDAMELLVFDADSRNLVIVRLEDAARGAALHIVPAGHWQAARPLGAFTRVVCTVAPGFVWDGFELLQPGSKVAHALAEAGALQL